MDESAELDRTIGTPLHWWAARRGAAMPDLTVKKSVFVGEWGPQWTKVVTVDPDDRSPLIARLSSIGGAYELDWSRAPDRSLPDMPCALGAESSVRDFRIVFPSVTRTRNDPRRDRHVLFHAFPWEGMRVYTMWVTGIMHDPGDREAIEP